MVGLAFERSGGLVLRPTWTDPIPAGITDPLKDFHPRLPMQVDEATVKRIARLARIRITEDEAKGLEAEISGILNWVEQLDEVDVGGVEPMTRVVPIKLKMRDDVVTDGEIADDVTRNAPLSDEHFYVVPKVVE
jgi:aspartyl-tRNA(Asn)/glutamyl-tRNA(Gln) amidotransferase subunit C